MVKRIIQIMVILVAVFLTVIRIRLLISDIHLRKGQIFVNSGNNEQAIIEFQRALKLDNSNGMGHLWLGLAYSKLGKYEQAIDALDKAKINWISKDLFNLLGIAYVHKWKFQKAIIEFEQDVTFFPNFAQAHFNLGHAYLLHAGNECLPQGKLKLAKEMIDKASESYQRAIELNPSLKIPKQLNRINSQICLLLKQAEKEKD